MADKLTFYNRVVEELNLDTRDSFTNLLANACALCDQRDEQAERIAQLERESGALEAECAKLSGELSVVRLRNQQLEGELDAMTRAFNAEERESFGLAAERDAAFNRGLDLALAFCRGEMEAWKSSRGPLPDDVHGARSACMNIEIAIRAVAEQEGKL